MKMRIFAVIAALMFLLPNAASAQSVFTMTVTREGAPECANGEQLIRMSFSGDVADNIIFQTFNTSIDEWSMPAPVTLPYDAVDSGNFATPIENPFDKVVVDIEIDGSYHRLEFFTGSCDIPNTQVVVGVDPEPVDTDGDTVNDDVDECPEVAGPADNGGCPVVTEPVDTDGDGVNDDVDVCPTVPGPAVTDGCPAGKEVDTDGDTVNDDVDECPTVAGPVENDGCPIVDPVDPVDPTPVPGGDGDGDGDSDGDGGAVDNGGDTDVDLTPAPVAPAPAATAPAVNPVTGLPITGSGPAESSSMWLPYAAVGALMLLGAGAIGIRRREA